MAFLSILEILVVFLLISCGQVDYPKKLSPDKAVTQDLSQYTLSFKEVMEFHEGHLAEYTVSGVVPEPGTSLISVENLPKGASFLAPTKSISWTPGLGTLGGAAYKTYEVVITLTSSINPGLHLKRTAVLLLLGANE